MVTNYWIYLFCILIMFITLIILNKILTICSWNPLNCIVIWDYKNALNVFLKALDWLHSILLLLSCLKFQVFDFVMPIAQLNVIFLFEICHTSLNAIFLFELCHISLNVFRYPMFNLLQPHDEIYFPYFVNRVDVRHLSN
jgi:hypothetical protein